MGEAVLSDGGDSDIGESSSPPFANPPGYHSAINVKEQDRHD